MRCLSLVSSCGKLISESSNLFDPTDSFPMSSGLLTVPGGDSTTDSRPPGMLMESPYSKSSAEAVPGCHYISHEKLAHTQVWVFAVKVSDLHRGSMGRTLTTARFVTINYLMDIGARQGLAYQGGSVYSSAPWHKWPARKSASSLLAHSHVPRSYYTIVRILSRINSQW